MRSSGDSPSDDPEDEIQKTSDGINRRAIFLSGTALAAASALASGVPSEVAHAQQPPATPSGKQPNILVIMGDDVGWFNIGAYHQGIMSGKTPNLDKLAAEGMRFTDYYAEASCTAGRANFITGRDSAADGHDDCRASGRGCRLAGSGRHDRDSPQIARLCDGAIRQEPPRRQE